MSPSVPLESPCERCVGGVCACAWSRRDYFIRNLHDALSGHSSNSVEEAIAYSEQSNTKCIGITIETRPDYCLKPHLNSMLQVRGYVSVRRLARHCC